MRTNADIYNALTCIKAELNNNLGRELQDATLKKHLDGIYEVCDLLQDLIEAKNKGK